MEARRATHPSADVLKAFGLGKLDAASAGTVMDHLDLCADCRKEVAALSGDDFLARIRRARGRSSTPAPADTPSDSVAGRKPPLPPPSRQTAVPNLPAELAANPQYEVLRELGRGGMGVVYLARNKLMDRLEVLKVVNKALLDRPGAVERFLREIRSAAKLSHVNVVAAYSALQLGDLLAFAMEYVEGEDLAALVKSRGPLPVPHACYYVQQAALGLQHAFEKKMVHRDIKPQNLMLAREGRKHVVKVLDFGLAKVKSEKADDTGLTGEGKMLGTPDYIAPEQTLDAARADIRADVYSLGCTLYYLLTGAAPFKGRSLYEVLQAHHSLEARPLNLARPEVPEELAAVVRKMMAKEPARRYQTPAEVAQALSVFARQGAKGAAAPKSPPELSVGAPSAKPDPPVAPAAEGAERQGAVAEVAAPVAWETLTEESITSAEPRKSGAVRKGRPPAAKPVARKKWWVIGGSVAAGLLLLGLLSLWAAGVFKVKTKDGTLVLEDLPAGAEVLVDGGKATVRWGADGKSAEVRIAPGKRQVVVQREGLQVKGEEVVIEEGGRTRLTVRLEPPPKAAPPMPQRDPDKPLPPRDWWEELFNKKDLRAPLPGQRGKPWFVTDGVLENGTGGSIFTQKTYANFTLSLEFQISADTAATIDIWSYPGDTPIWVFLDNTRGAMGAITWDLKEKGFTVGRLSPPAELRPDGQWNELTIEVSDGELSVILNGRALSTANIGNHVDKRRSDSPPAERLTGRIGLTKRWGRGKILIRKLSIKEL
jgi:serine/threonine protein kinase